jgi:hypothetical protein
MFKLIRRAFQSAFRDLGQPVSPSMAASPSSERADDDVLIGVRGNVPVYLGGAKKAIAQLKPVYTRSHRNRGPVPAEQGAVGLKCDAAFQPPPGPPAKPVVERRGMLDSGWRPEREAYAWNPRREVQPGMDGPGMGDAEMALLLDAGAGPGSFARSPGPAVSRGSDGRGR